MTPQMDTAADDTMPQPRTVTERLRLAIRSTRDYHERADDPNDELAAEFQRQLRLLGLRLTWANRRIVTLAQLWARSER